MVLGACKFETERLLVCEWHSLLLNDRQLELAHVVTALLTEPVTRWLPTSRQGNYTLARASEWIKQRDDDETTLLAIDKVSDRPVGLMILSEVQVNESSIDTEVRLGYLLAEDAWGKGIASELVKGFVSWCRGRTSISSIVGGVASDNSASKRVLERNGFHPVQSGNDVAHDEQLFRLSLKLTPVGEGPLP